MFVFHFVPNTNIAFVVDTEVKAITQSFYLYISQRIENYEKGRQQDKGCSENQENAKRMGEGGD